MNEKLIPWIVLVVYLISLLLIDYFILHKKDKIPTVKKALFETLFFIANALIFSGILYWCYDNSLIANINNLSPAEAVTKYITGYLIELSLSIDNLFVIAVIFTSFKIPNHLHHKLLFLGILGALLFRAILIGLGLLLIDKIEGITIFFGLFLLYTAFKMLKKEDEDKPKSKGLLKYFRYSDKLDGNKFISIVNNKKVLTPLFGALITIEFTDLLFALDSIPAIFSITTDPFIVYSSNIFAIMGLRSLYFFLSDMLGKFSYLKYSVFLILVFVSFKLIMASYIHIPEWISLLFIATSILGGVIFSMIKNKT